MCIRDRAAVNNWAPYGIIPCQQDENISSILAVFLLSISYLSAISLANGPAATIAIVLFAVHKSITLTNAAIPNSAPFLLFILLVIKYNT